MERTRHLNVGPGAAAGVSVINTGNLRDIPTEGFLHPTTPGYDFLNVPCYAFLVQNPGGKKVMFDLGLRKDWQRLSPTVLAEVERYRMRIEMQDDAIDSLHREGIPLEEIDAVVLSHHHWDHIGDLSLFPSTTSVIVGPGFVGSFMPGYPENLQSPILATDYRGKKVTEVDFEKYSKVRQIGSFRGIDYFGDGSFYLVDAPGHSQGHICGLVRTSVNPDTFILLGADACHHNGEFRPSESRELPQASCFGRGFHRYLESIGRNSQTPFFGIPEDPKYAAYTHDLSDAKQTVQNVQDIDGYDNLFVIMAHDASILGHIEFFPKHLNGWKQQDLAEKCRWSFLNDFQIARDSRI